MKCLLSLLLLIHFTALCQNKNFEIIGNSDFYNDKQLIIETVLTILNDSGYVDAEIFNRPLEIPVNLVDVKNSQFKVEGQLNYPTPFNVSYYDEISNQGFISEIFFIDSEKINISFTDLSKDPKIHFSTETTSNIELDSIKNLSNWNDSFLVDINDQERTMMILQLQDYITNHPDSFVAFWVLLIEYVNNGYNEEIYNSLELFSPSIKKIKPYITFEKRALLDRKIEESMKTKKFPFSEFAYGEKIQNLCKTSNFVLVDFWATWCKPCISQFEQLIEVKNLFNDCNVAFISISVDNLENQLKAESILKENQVNWENIFDIGGKDFNKFSNILPTTLVFNSEGNFLARDLSINELKIFFQEQCK